jgi:hypothetical protein
MAATYYDVRILFATLQLAMVLKFRISVRGFIKYKHRVKERFDTCLKKLSQKVG